MRTLVLSDAETDEPKRSDPSNSATVWAVFLAAVMLALAMPAAEAVRRLFYPPKRLLPEAGAWLSSGFSFGLEMLPTVGIAVLAATWIFVFWSLIGSFLNVVVHRLPLGQSVILGGSHCPRCSSPIKWHDNLPVVGWLRLHGRCRSCDLPISARYPVVESVCAGLGTAVYFRELLSGGINLPGRVPDLLHDGMLRLIPNAGPDLIGLYAYHCFALCMLLAWGLIAYDGHRLPGRSVLLVLFVAAGLPLVFPSLHPLPLGLATSAAGGLAGLLSGTVLSSVFHRLLRGDAAGRSGLPLVLPRQLSLGLVLVGIVFGWQGMLGTAVLLLGLCLIQILVWSSSLQWPTLPVELLLVPAAFIHLYLWRQLVVSLGVWWPGPAPTAACLVIPAALLVVVTLALMAITPAHGRQPTASKPSRTDPSPSLETNSNESPHRC